MKTITGDKYLDFVIEHYDDIKALNELWDRAEKKLPDWVNKELDNIIDSLEYGYMDKMGLKTGFIEEDDECIWFDPKICDIDFDEGTILGPYFGCTLDSDWQSLVDPEKAIMIYVYCKTDGLKKQESQKLLKKWKMHFKKYERKLSKKEIILEPDETDEYYLLGYYLRKELNISILRNPGVFRKAIQKAVKDFTSAVLPIMKLQKRR